MTDEEIVKSELQKSRKDRNRILSIAKNIQDLLPLEERYSFSIGNRVADGLAEAALRAFETHGVAWIREARLQAARELVEDAEKGLIEKREALRALEEKS